MNQKEIKELVEFLIEKDIAEFELERGDVKVRIRRAAPEPQQPVERIISVPAPVPMHADGSWRGACTRSSSASCPGGKS